jgi:ribosomal protein L25 (general stress protein Ctc)
MAIRDLGVERTHQPGKGVARRRRNNQGEIMANGYAPGNGSPEQDARLELRVSRADRDRVVETLTAAASEGLLAADELDDRVEAALSARTRGELAVLTTDLGEI